MFCRNCGNKLCDEAYVCPNCGVLAAGEKLIPKEGVVDEKKEATLRTLLILVFGLFCVTFLFVILTIIGIEVEVRYYKQIYEVYIDFNWGCLIFAFVISIIDLILGIIALVLGLKIPNKALKLMSIFCFMLSLTMLVITIAVMMIMMA